MRGLSFRRYYIIRSCIGRGFEFMQRTLTRSLIFFFCARDRGICTLVNSAPRCLAAHGLAAAPEESIGMRSSVSSASIFPSAWVAEESRAPGSRGNRQTLSELAASNPAAPPPPRAANRLSASGRICGRTDTPRQREARRPRLAAMTARKRFYWGMRLGIQRSYQIRAPCRILWRATGSTICDTR